MTKYSTHPPSLKEAKDKNEIVFFVGAGISIPYGGKSWITILELMINQIKQEIGYEILYDDLISHLNGSASYKADAKNRLKEVFLRTYDPLMIAQLFEDCFHRHSVIDFLLKETKCIKGPGKLHDLLYKLTTQMIVTTNYDNLLEQAAKRLGLVHRSIVKEQDVAYWSDNELKIIKMHGSLEDPLIPDSVIFTRKDYEAYILKRPTLSLLLQFIMTTKCLILIGYSAQDPDFIAINDMVRFYLKQHKRNIFLVLYDAPDVIQDYWFNYGFYPINLDGSDKTKSLEDWLSSL